MGKFHGNRIVSNMSIYAARIKYEAKLLNAHYDKSFVSTSFYGMRQSPKLICNAPKCWLLSPTFENPQHIYKNDGRLCLYDPDNNEWNRTSNIFNTFVPWCMEWVVFQMIYEETGEWQHPERHPNGLSEKELKAILQKFNIT